MKNSNPRNNKRMRNESKPKKKVVKQVNGLVHLNLP
jgi:hypothetical protein